MAQPQYYIVATRRCRTHRPGTMIVYTGPRHAIARGWRVIACCADWDYGAMTLL